MATLLIDMPSGVAGDMLLGALLACGGDAERLRTDLLGLGLGPIGITVTPAAPGGLAALKVDVAAGQEARWVQDGPLRLAGARPGPMPQGPAATGLTAPTGGHDHRPYRDIRALLDRSTLPERVRQRAQRVFRLLAEAEAAVHGVDPETVEFHEVGALDAIADVVGCCLVLEQLGVDRVVAGPLLPGHGTVRCAHGRMPVPVPAVAEILRRTGAPSRTVDADTGELTTPTGAALVCALAEGYVGAGLPSGTWRVRASGFGAGTKVVPGFVNAVRCLLLEPMTLADPASERVVELRCQVDDATGEQLAVLAADLLAAGALDVVLVPVVMKKGRPGTRIEVLCAPADRARLTRELLIRSPSIGVRWTELDRQVLPRRTMTVQIAGHAVAVKISTLPDGSERAKPEADDVHRVALALGLTFAEIQQRALAALDRP